MILNKFHELNQDFLSSKRLYLKKTVIRSENPSKKGVKTNEKSLKMR